MTRRRKPAPATLSVPVNPHRLWRLLGGGFATLGLAAALVWAAVAGLPDRAMLGIATAASQAGFVVRRVEISGTRHQEKLGIYREVLAGGSDSMLLADIVTIRSRLQELPWVRDASVARRWPDTLVIRIVERKPAAIWQHRGTLRLIDADGQPLPNVPLDDFAALPLLVGRTAAAEADGFLQLIASEPALAAHMQAAVRVGERRWDLKMLSGETLSLPEGDAAAAALRRFAAINRKTPLLGKGFVRFDMRIPEKMVVRVSGEAGAKAKPRAPDRAVPQAGLQTAQRAASAPTEVVI